MHCWYPQDIRRVQTVKDKKTGVLVQRYNGYIQVPCGRCPPCRRRKQNEWAFRILEESKYHRITAFITLTYNDDNLVYINDIPTLCPEHLTTFCKNLRYNLEYKDSSGKTQSFRFFACGEYGDQFDRPHYHMILFYNGPLSHDDISTIIQNRWSFGFIQYDENVTAGRAKYCAKYSMKQLNFDYGDVVPPFARMSRRPGIGKCFLSDIDTDLFRSRDLWCVHDYQGTPYNLPRYYRERIYHRDQIEQHSFLLSQVIGDKRDSDIYRLGRDIFYKTAVDRIEFQDYLFIKHLKCENYGFKFRTSRRESRRLRFSSDEFTTDEF